MFLSGKDAAAIDQMAKMKPLERLGAPGDTTKVVAFLAGPGRWVNGQTRHVNGGMV